MNPRHALVILAFGLVGWALCGSIVGIGREVTTIDNALVAHAVGAPIIFGALAWAYHTRFGYTSPLQTAAIFTILVITMDAVVTAPLIEGSFEMFESVLGTWFPFSLIFSASLVSGLYATRGITSRPI